MSSHQIWRAILSTAMAGILAAGSAYLVLVWIDAPEPAGRAIHAGILAAIVVLVRSLVAGFRHPDGSSTSASS